MKKLTVNILLLLFFAIFNLHSQTPWERLQNTRRAITLNFMLDAESRDKFILCPTILPKPGLPANREHVLLLAEINSLLEAAGVNEPVTIELFNLENRLIAHIGTFEPVGSSGSQGIKWILPKYKIIPLPRQEIRAILGKRFQEGISLAISEPGLLVFKDPSKEIKAQLEVGCMFPFKYEKPQYAELDALLGGNKMQAAFHYCNKLTGKIRYECFSIMAEAFFWEAVNQLIMDENHMAVEAYCNKVAEKTKSDEMRSHCCRVAAETYFDRKDYNRAIQYFSKTEPYGDQEINNRVGEAYYQLGDYKKAVEYHEKGLHSIGRANAYCRLADYYKQQGEKNPVKTYYKKAIQEYEFMIKSNEYEWDDRDNAERLRCRKELAAFEKTPEEKARQKKLETILEKTALYCRRLEKSMIHFFCKEVVKEIFTTNTGSKKRNSFIYEYQLIRDGPKITERRILLERNGYIIRQEDVPLGTRVYRYNKLIFGPIGFFDKFWQDYFDYKIVNEEMVDGQKTVVIEAIPLRRLKTNFVCGKIWVAEKDYGILKIQWVPKFFVEKFNKALESAKWHNARLHIDFISEFNKERNRIRFPSKYYIAEYHVHEDGKQELRAQLDVKFKDFMFFTVGTDVSYR